MVVNQKALLADPPFVDMMHTKVRKHGVSHGLAEAGYDICINQSVAFFPGLSLGSIHIDCADDGRRIEDGNFCLASAIEEFDMPNTLVGIVHDKSSWARQGLSVFNTVIEPGWKGFLTLELVYHGRQPLIIPAGAGIAQVIFHKVAVPAQYVGKFQNQEDRPVANIMYD